MGKPGSTDDYLHDGVLQFSAGDPGTVYRAARAPQEGEFLEVGLGSARAVGSVTVLRPAGAKGAADIQLRNADGDWRTVGRLGGAYTGIETHGRTADAVRLTWREGAEAPQIAEVVAGR
ncbi:hypothetical protein [Streptomyces sp. ITFR-6]|uniref:hypothetical protein n=1 Tax=Streptomyces sp. ITFR-6 TaxID=3075197 RepID=UPI00288A41F1|nr:hypothetical protein [Streptomyces sp. ITFR-6]WNI27572.1 hypothetical protein RLT59_01340 [Streptomyces sp. ITFR-6]